MRYLHTMLRVRNLDAALDFYCNKLGLAEARRHVDEKNKYTLVFLAAPGDGELVAKGPQGRAAPLVELTYNWDSGERITVTLATSATSPTKSMISMRSASG